MLFTHTGLLFSTEFQQLALVVFANAAFEDLRAHSLLPDDFQVTGRPSIDGYPFDTTKGITRIPFLFPKGMPPSLPFIIARDDPNPLLQVAGHSLGEYAAMSAVARNALPMENVLDLVFLRGPSTVDSAAPLLPPCRFSPALERRAWALAGAWCDNGALC